MTSAASTTGLGTTGPGIKERGEATLNKSALSRLGARLQTYRRFLPSLDLKRRQLLLQRVRERERLAEDRAVRAAIDASVAERLPMLADADLDLADLVRVELVELDEENALGTRLPVLRSVRLDRSGYSLLARPHWVDAAADLLARALEFEVRIGVGQKRLQALDHAVRSITQRVNLFDRVLIPRTEALIRRIRVHLADAERNAVVRAKLAKARKPVMR